MTTQQTYPWDAAEYLETQEDITAYLEAALEENDPSLIIAALRDIARSPGMSELTHKSGLGRESLDETLLTTDDPEFATVLLVLNALGLRFQVVPVS